MTRTRTVLFAALGLGYLAVLAFLYVHKPPSPDQSTFDYIGWIGTNGGHYYIDVAEQNFPGEMLLHEWATRLFGVEPLAFRALDCLILGSGAAALFWLLRQARLGVGAVVGVAFYLAGYVSSNPWMSGQRDAIGANLLLIAAALFCRRLSGGPRWLLLPLGAVHFFAVLLRPTYLLFTAALLGIDIWRRRASGRGTSVRVADAGLVAAVMIACAGSMIWHGVSVGSWSEFRDQVLSFNVESYGEGHSLRDTLGRLRTTALHYAWFLPAAIAALVATRRQHRWDAPLLSLLALVPLAMVSAVAQNKGFAYHMGAILAPVFGLTGVAAWRLAEYLQEHPGTCWRATTAVGLSVALAVTGLLLQARTLAPQVRYLVGSETFMEMMAREPAGGLTWAEMYAAAAFLRDSTQPSETVLVWGRTVGLHVLAERKSPTRFITHGMLLLAKPPFQRSREWAGEFVRSLKHAPPRIIVLQSIDGQLDFGDASFPNPNRDVTEGLRGLVDSRFEEVRSFGDWRVFRLAD